MNRSMPGQGALILWLAGLAILAAVLLGACSQDREDAVPKPGSVGLDEATLKRRTDALRKENAQLQVRLDKLVPKEPYIVVNTTLNRICLRKGGETLLDAVCSTGSNTQLTAPDGSRTWFFSTPRGVFKVKNRMERPVWVRPDWAFVEEGEPVPTASSPERFEEGVLGDYGLYFGGGYLIHGTLFQRFLGQNVTHGCIRVGDEDLAQIWKVTRVGTPVYIF